MKIHIVIGFALITLLMAYGCSSDSDGPLSIAPPPIQGGEESEPETLVQDSTNAIYRQFFFRGTHNSYSGNFGGMKREGIGTQLERGLRFFEFDLFSFHTYIEMQTDWTDKVDGFSVFEYDDNPYILSYSHIGEDLKVYRIVNGKLELVYGKSGRPHQQVEKKFYMLSHNKTQYIMDYEPGSGYVTIHRFNGTSLTSMGTFNLGVINADLSTFFFNGKAYLGIYTRDEGSYKIQEILLAGEEVALGNTPFETKAVTSKEMLYPFEQDDRLYVFRHNVNSVTNFRVESVDVNNMPWIIKDSRTGTSDFLMGAVQVTQTNGKLFVNSYAANGDVFGTQLIIDDGEPNLVYEYNNTEDMLSGANVSLYPSDKGVYLFLQKGHTVQLSSISLGKLTLGHDSPGDEVDLSVDNPPSVFLEDWIGFLVRWSNENPNHEPLFIMTELKEYEQWLADAKWQNIIELMQSQFGNKLRYHNSSGFHSESLVEGSKIVDGKTLYFMDENGSKEGGLLGKVVLYIQPNNNITKSASTNNFEPFVTKDGVLQENFLQLRRYRENNKLVSPDWRYPNKYGNDIGAYIDDKDNSYISRIFHMESSDGDGQYDNIRCTDVMFALSDRPYEGLFTGYADQQQVKNELKSVNGCD